VADYSNGGSERFLRGLAKKDDRPLKLGDKITGTVRLQMRQSEASSRGVCCMVAA
jgi:hypothetical protein